ncbi:MAG TPA: efflux transporter outer membrane subunit [Chryseolinea sp.]
MKITLHRAVTFGCVVAVLTSCSLSQAPLRLENTLPATYQHVLPDTGSMAQEPWNVFYADTCLRSFISIALQSNPDTKAALQRIRLAYADYALMHSRMLPNVNALLKGNVERFGRYTMNGIGNEDTNRSESLPADQQLPNPYPELFGGLSFNWEVNLWGKLSSRRQAAFNRLMASEEMRHGVVTWLISAIAENYYELMGLDQERKVLLENLRLQEFGLELVAIQKAGGKVNQLAVDQFESTLLSTRTRLVRVEQNIRVTEARVNQLLGRYPQPLSRDSIRHYTPIREVKAGSPEKLLRYRPDIRESEYTLLATHADVQAARAAFYPSLNLMATGGFSAFDVSKWFLMPGSSVYSLGAGLSAPIFQRRQIKALYASANARQQLALTLYEKSLLTGYHEVFALLHNFYSLRTQIDLKQQETDVLHRAFASSNDLFAVGFATYLEVIMAQRRVLDVELELTDLRMEQLKNVAALYRATGGGWREPSR